MEIQFVYHRITKTHNLEHKLQDTSFEMNFTSNEKIVIPPLEKHEIYLLPISRRYQVKISKSIS